MTSVQGKDDLPNILVVEDDPRMQKVLNRLFRDEGYGVVVASDGQAGLDAFRVSNPVATLEVRELSGVFERMRRETLDTNRALLESERLATIGRMASSVSHDLRHYLAAVYANAEFLSSPKLSDAERSELFAEIRMAVLGRD